eukprot:1148399-Pelagomonas_calceolata.AAC.1
MPVSCPPATLPHELAIGGFDRRPTWLVPLQTESCLTPDIGCPPATTLCTEVSCDGKKPPSHEELPAVALRAAAGFPVAP